MDREDFVERRRSMKKATRRIPTRGFMWKAGWCGAGLQSCASRSAQPDSHVARQEVQPAADSALRPEAAARHVLVLGIRQFDRLGLDATTVVSSTATVIVLES